MAGSGTAARQTPRSSSMPLSSGAASRNATEEKLRLLEARLTGGRGMPPSEDTRARQPSSCSPPVVALAAQSVQRTPNNNNSGGKANRGRQAGQASFALSSPSAHTPVMQVDTSLDSDPSGEEGGGEAAGVSRSGWAIQANNADSKRRRLAVTEGGRSILMQPLMENQLSRSGSEPLATALESKPKPPSRSASGRRQRQRQTASVQQVSDSQGTAPSVVDLLTAPKAAASGRSGKAQQHTINRYFQTLTDSCSRDSDSVPDKQPETAGVTGGALAQSARVEEGKETAACQTDGPSAAEVEERAAEMKVELERLQQQAEEAKRLRDEATQRADAADKEVEELRKEALDLRTQSDSRERRAQGSVRLLAQRCCRFERKAVDAQLQQDGLRLGSIGVQRTGAMLTEVWVDGPAFQDIERRQETLTSAREEIEALRKSLKKQLPLPEGLAGVKTGAATDGSGGSRGQSGKGKEQPGSITPKEYVAREEVLKTRLMAIKREEDSLAKEKERLEAERGQHIRELKRRKDEDDSRFNDTPLLHNRYVLMGLLGKGGFSEVHRAYDLEEMREVAVKIHQLNSQWSERKRQNYVKHSVREYHIHQSLRHPRVVALLDIFEVDDTAFATVLEICYGGDLEAHLREHAVLPEREARAVVAQILDGLAYLNQPHRRIIHYDLKPANIMFDACGEVKITDFGLSKIVEEGQTNGMELTSQGAGTYWYLPPECFETGSPMISSKVDVWSVGVIFYQMLYGRRPFGHDQSQENILRQKTITNAQTVEFPSRPSVSAEAKEFIRRCLAYRQHNRPDVHEAVADPYISAAGKAAPDKRGSK